MLGELDWKSIFIVGDILGIKDFDLLIRQLILIREFINERENKRIEGFRT